MSEKSPIHRPIVNGSEAQWRVHVTRLMAEIVSNRECTALTTPLNILRGVLLELAQCAIRINDPELNALMARLALYDVSDPDDPRYDPKVVEALLETASLLKKDAQSPKG